MRILISIFILVCALSAPASEWLLQRLEPQGYVNDFANVISSSEEQQLTSMITELRQKTGAEIAVVTIQSLEGGEIDDFTNRLFEKWGIGQRGKDNGLMFLAAMKDRKMRIEVGYGLEGAIPDAKAGRIRRDVITPYFKSGQPGKGIVVGVAALSQEVAKAYGVEPTGRREILAPLKQIDPIFYQLFGIVAVIAVLAVIGHVGGSIETKRRGYRGTTSAKDQFYSGGSSGGFGGGGYGGGGFGGGCSGGGGSSGGW